MNTVEAVFQLLNVDHFVSGQVMADELEVSRNAIWKAISQLKKRGVSVYAVTGKGYKVPQVYEILQKNLILKTLKGSNHGFDVELLFETDSTNQNLLKKSILDDKLHICASEWQSQGRGRLQRQWLAPMASHLSFSFARYWHHDFSLLSGMSLAAGVSVVKALRLLGIENVMLKWPNDIVYPTEQGLAKLGGILVEMRGNADSGMQWVIGIGLNIADISHLQQQINQQALGLANIHPAPVSRNTLLSTIVLEWLDCEKKLIEQGLGAIVADWRAYDALCQQPVVMEHQGKIIKGLSMGVDERGQLLVKNEKGVTAYGGGEVQLKKSMATDVKY
ncbi:MAG: biotin--[acetyl-CoA-carboxylase] ligase [Gammaproteobacteria bacterium CG22_combo_CG10-13_8_21_14_all_40_8]|nr:MAG: biotin--[acetyl-CoA-carboxylase] ligase [Gammaproteobacteria bacterium CG22_combo_CG10-13_8_21_14_all_40_8]